VNGRLSRSSLRCYLPFTPLAGRLLSCFSAVVARTEDDMGRFARLGVAENVLSVSADSKFLADSGDPPAEWRGMFRTAGPVLVAGSTRKGEEDAILEGAMAAGYFPVIVPRHLDRVGEVESIMLRRGLEPVRWSVLSGEPEKRLDFDSVIVDVHGVLARMYGTGDAAFVGGTLAPVGGHNVLEPLMRGVPLLVGPDYGSFGEAVERFRVIGAARVFRTSEELGRILEELKDGPAMRDRIISEFNEMRNSLLSGIFRVLELTGILEDRGKT
jgi:3-deoxy-D-manno-octulosonic-acid transferase